MRRPAQLFLPAVAVFLLADPALAQEPARNLQVLPADIPRAELSQIMRGFTSALGVRCSTCHMGEEGQPLSTYDFASDEKPMKAKARAMLRMSMAINDDHLAQLPGRREPNVPVTCVTCHRGVARPQPIEEVVSRTLEEEGVDTAVERYRQLRQRYFGGFAYDFTDRPLASLGEALWETDPQAAIRVLELNLEFNPSSAASFLGLAQIHDSAQDTAKAIENYRKVLELQPDNGRVQRRLQELGGR